MNRLWALFASSRIFDPADSGSKHPERVFSWLICESYDDKGNAIVYDYVRENEQHVKLAQANGITVDEAFQVIRRFARRNNQRLTDVSRAVVTDPAALRDL